MHCYFGIGTPCDFSFSSHSGYVSRDMCCRSHLYGSCVFVRVLFRELFSLSFVHVTKPFNFPGSSGGTDIAAWRAWKAPKSTLCGVCFHVDTIIRFSAGLYTPVLSIRTSHRDGGTTARPHHVRHPPCLVSKFDTGYVRDHSHLPVPFRTYCSILFFVLLVFPSTT